MCLEILKLTPRNPFEFDGISFQYLKGDPDANANFVKINRAYEILKDEDLRKKYDQFGEDGLKDQNQNQGWNQYQSWNFYQQMGIYDENPEVITLTRSDFSEFFLSSNLKLS